MQLDLFTLIVDDYDAAIAFFVDALQFTLCEDKPALTNDGHTKRWVVVRPPNGGTGLLLAQADDDRQAATVGNQFAERVGLFLRVDDFDGTFNHMQRYGVVFIGQPRTEAYGKVVVFLDIAGNRWDLLGPK
jgi:catechol 2,3-dioxygenase-like lactoylglutathione lyase family enzyme